MVYNWPPRLGMGGVSALAVSVWLHHFFTMGASADVDVFFGTMTMFIAIPTSALVFNWIATMYKGRIRFETPMLWFLGFAFIFAIGGMSGVILAVPPADFQLHNSLFLVAHFHSTVIGGVLFGIFCALSYWFPKITGFRLNERIGKYAFWCWIVGFCLSFIPMYILGLMGATRRLDHYDASTGWQPLFIMMFIGGLVIATGVVLQVAQILASFIQKDRLRDTTGDPWDGRSLEWSTPSPPQPYNYTSIPQIATRDAFLEMKRHGRPEPKFEDIRTPKNTASGIYIATFGTAACLGFVWNIKWLIVGSLLGIIVTLIWRTFDEHTEYILTAEEVRQLEIARHQKDRAANPATEYNADKDMGLRELISYLFTFVRKKGWRAW